MSFNGYLSAKLNPVSLLLFRHVLEAGKFRIELPHTYIDGQRWLGSQAMGMRKVGGVLTCGARGWC